MKKIDKKSILYTAQEAQRIAYDLITLYNVVNNNPDILNDEENIELKDLRITMGDWAGSTSFLVNHIVEKANKDLLTKN